MVSGKLTSNTEDTRTSPPRCVVPPYLVNIFKRRTLYKRITPLFGISTSPCRRILAIGHRLTSRKHLPGSLVLVTDSRPSRQPTSQPASIITSHPIHLWSALRLLGSTGAIGRVIISYEAHVGQRQTTLSQSTKG